MNGITILKDETHNRRLMQIDLNELAMDSSLIEDLYDVITIEVRKMEEIIPWEKVKENIQM